MAKGKKTGGRERGTPNRITNETREIVKTILRIELPNLQTYISEIERPEIKARILIDLLPYVTPKYQSIDFGIETIDNGKIIRVIREDESETGFKNNLPPFMRANLPEWINEE